MTYNPEIFKAGDIRGEYNKDFDGEFGFMFGRAVVRYLNATTILIGRDNRSFSSDLAKAVIDGVTSAGCDAEYIDLSTTPFFNFVLNKAKPGGGIMITASHNPPEYGGFKVFDKKGLAIGLDSGLNEIRNIIDHEPSENSKYGGKVVSSKRSKYLEEYVDFAVKRSKVGVRELAGLKVKISGPQAVMEEVEILKTKLGLTFYPYAHDIAFSFDEDSDRLLVDNGHGDIIRSDYILGLLARDAVRFLSKPRIVYDLRFSRGVINKFKEWGMKRFPSRVGRLFVREAMIKNRGDLGGELSGHIYFKENNCNEMPLLAILKLLKILAASKMSIGEMIKPFQTWINSGEINLPKSNELPIPQLLEKLKKKYEDGEVDVLDGLTVEYIDWWFNIRSSNTESLIRLIVEAKTKDLLDEKVSELKNIM